MLRTKRLINIPFVITARNGLVIVIETSYQSGVVVEREKLRVVVH